MISDNTLRRAVKVLAWSLFLLSCYNLVMMVIAALCYNQYKINVLDIVNIFAALGLLRWRNGWRIYCIVIFWLAAIIFGLMPLVFLAIKAIPRELYLYRPGFWMLYCLWEFYCIFALITLHNRRVKAMFAPPKDQTAAAEEPADPPGTPGDGQDTAQENESPRRQP